LRQYANLKRRAQSRLWSHRPL